MTQQNDDAKQVRSDDEQDVNPDPTAKPAERKSLARELANLLNRHSRENASNTPDWVLAEYLVGCLENFETFVNKREKWYGVQLIPARGRELGPVLYLDPTRQPAPLGTLGDNPAARESGLAGRPPTQHYPHG